MLTYAGKAVEGACVARIENMPDRPLYAFAQDLYAGSGSPFSAFTGTKVLIVGTKVQILTAEEVVEDSNSRPLRATRRARPARSAYSRMLTYAHVSSRMLTYTEERGERGQQGPPTHVCSRILTYAHVCSRMLSYEASEASKVRLLTYPHLYSHMLTDAHVC